MLTDVQKIIAPDAGLERVARAFRDCLPDQDCISVFRIDSLDRLELPVVQAALMPPRGHCVIGYGYGATAAASTVGALGELCEEVHVGEWLGRTPSIPGSYSELARTHPGVVDPLTLCLAAGSDYAPDLSLDWIEAEQWPTGDKVLLPREWIAAYPHQLDAPAKLITPITNGLGAGLSLAQALAHGIMELLQRDGNVLSYRALDQGIVVDMAMAPADLRALIARFERAGITAQVKLASADFGLSNVYVVGDDHGIPTVPIQMSACGEACHPDAAAAIRKALLELAGSRSRKAATHGPFDLVRATVPDGYADTQMIAARNEFSQEEPRALAAMAGWLAKPPGALRAELSTTLFAERRHVAFADLPSVPAGDADQPDRRLAILTERLSAAGLPICYVDCSPPGSNARVVKVVVPGLESETMSYHRIGWRGVRRLRDRESGLISDTPKAGAGRVRLRPEDEARAGGPAWFDSAAADRIVASFYPLYREPGPFAARLLLDRQDLAPR